MTHMTSNSRQESDSRGNIHTKTDKLKNPRLTSSGFQTDKFQTSKNDKLMIPRQAQKPKRDNPELDDLVKRVRSASPSSAKLVEQRRSCKQRFEKHKANLEKYPQGQ